jgi:hypothetical protein
MADLTATSTITAKKERRAAMLSDTIGQTRTMTYTVALPNPANTADTVTIGAFPAGCALLGVFTKANAAAASGCGIEYGLSANANGAGASVAVANVANGANTAWTYSPAAATANVGTQSSTADCYLVATIRGANTAAVHTLTITAVVCALDPSASPYSTYTT